MSRRPPSRRPAGRRRGRGRRRVWKLPLGRSSMHIRAFMMALLLLVMVCVGRTVQLQALEAQSSAAQAAEKMKNTRELLPERGAITDRNKVVLAVTQSAMRITADPDMVQSNGADKRYPVSAKKQEEADATPKAAAKILAAHLGGNKSRYLEILSAKDTRYAEIVRHVPAATWSKIEEDMQKGIDGDGKRRWYGLLAEDDPLRTYPNRTSANNVVGFVNGDGKGAAGLEGLFDLQLAGIPGQEVYEHSTYGRILLGTSVLTPPVNGASYSLTIDADLQWFAEQVLADGMAKAGAKTGSVLVMNLNNGEVLALATAPSFDSANPGATDVGNLGNRTVTEAYEPGSTGKILTMAALADSGLVTPDTKVDIPASITSGSSTVKDSFEHGRFRLTARGVMAQSSNIGIIKPAHQMDKAKLRGYLASLGLGSASGSGLPTETSGSFPEADMTDYTRDQISFGQGLFVSVTQMGAALPAAVNGGTYHRPQIIRSAANADGTPISLPTPTLRRVISEEASGMVVSMMEAVITNVSSERAIPGYHIAGKSGTAQCYGSSRERYNGCTSSFVGIAPAGNPQLLVYVVLDQPTNGNLGSQLALPVVNNVPQTALPNHNVAPSSTPAPRESLEWE